MRTSGSRKLFYAATIALPSVLIFSSIQTFLELDAQRDVYLRERAAHIAGTLEVASTHDEPIRQTIEALAESEPHLRDLRVTMRPDDAAGNPGLQAVWNGRELFHTEFLNTGGARTYRVYVPFHSAGQMNVAQIDLDVAASDFLVTHARHNVIVSVIGGIVLVLISVYSLRAAKRAAELEHLAQLGTMSAVLAHEIRNPLGTIKGFVQLALESGGTTLASLLTPVLEQTHRLESLVNDLLVYGRPPVPSIREIRWTDLATTLRAHAHQLTTNRDIQVSIADSTAVFSSDPNLLEQVLLNLIRNAVDAVDKTPGARVEVAANAASSTVELQVRDNGPGIAPDLRGKVMQPFFTTKAFGTGLGIPISVRLAQSLRGTLDLQPATPHGTIATVRLPLR